MIKDTKKTNRGEDMEPESYKVPLRSVWDKQRRDSDGMHPDNLGQQSPEGVHPEKRCYRGYEHFYYSELFDGGSNLSKWNNGTIPKDEHLMLLEEAFT